MLDVGRTRALYAGPFRWSRIPPSVRVLPRHALEPDSEQKRGEPASLPAPRGPRGGGGGPLGPAPKIIVAHRERQRPAPTSHSAPGEQRAEASCDAPRFSPGTCPRGCFIPGGDGGVERAVSGATIGMRSTPAPPRCARPSLHPYAAAVLATARRRALFARSDRVLGRALGGPGLDRAPRRPRGAPRRRRARRGLTALHVDHGLRPGEADAACAAAACARLGVPLRRVAVEVARRERPGRGAPGPVRRAAGRGRRAPARRGSPPATPAPIRRRRCSCGCCAGPARAGSPGSLRAAAP